MNVNARMLNGGYVQARAFVVNQAFSFIGDFNPQTGTLLIPGHALSGKCMAGKVLVCPCGKGGTMAPFVLYEAHQRGLAPAAIFCDNVDPILLESAMIIDIPIFDRFETSVVELFHYNQFITINDESIILSHSLAIR
ncbi:aconitase X swivel domain-containing protein [Zooshikella sp. RANM57]|uniref:aconitase X swivel domain-containing protein n=1 Tax=Zooshikella sp. RANM57 TaxID=3425863 RepID=UPI003D6EDE57